MGFLVHMLICACPFWFTSRGPGEWSSEASFQMRHKTGKVLQETGQICVGIYIVLMPSVLYWYNFIHHIIWYFISRYNLCSPDVAIWYTLTHVFTRKKSYPSPDWSSWAESSSLGVMKCTVIAVFVYLEKIKLSFQMFPGGTGFMR